jgi:osmotically-inducible protein OsmY
VTRPAASLARGTRVAKAMGVQKQWQHRKRSRPASALAAVVALAAGAACGTSGPAAKTKAPEPRSAEAALAAGASQRTPAVTDTWIVAVLVRELQGDPVVGRERIEVDCANGVTTLHGEVSNRLAKDRAIAIAEVVRGIRAVVDRVTVEAKPRPDYELEFMAASALAADPAIAGQPIGVHAHAGVVRLAGNVTSNATRRIAESDLLALPGVLEVADDAAVVPAPRSDARLVLEVARLLHDDPWIEDARVHVAAKGGVVRISGVVDSAAERSRAEVDARACTPTDVDVTELRIEAVSDGTLREDPAPLRTDDDLTRAFLDAAARDPRVRPFVPGIQVRNRVAVITGEAPDSDAAQAVEEDARNVPGMADVHVDLDVATATARTDAAVLAQARGVIERDPRLSARRVSVEVLHGWVTLRGNLRTESERRQAVAAATSVPGVRGVDDELVVDPPTLAHP